MDKRMPVLADHLLLIERELRERGWWQSTPPDAKALASQEPFCVDTMAFEQWLQWIFLPRMKVILEQDLPLPKASGIREMAEMVYVERPDQARTLITLLERFDQLIGKAG
ncbi:YqcC family protein [Pseudomonas syringae]|nr:YqcC family protein [Pseudomonas syringae]MBD8793366.1 YqcC family protein [Pseudomonas syringae]MBD8804046.1 YqcC family protein [Pseudomonas syringae]MBD8814900.1 YqcC family protein [Pseudomonas syringae]